MLNRAFTASYFSLVLRPITRTPGPDHESNDLLPTDSLSVSGLGGKLKISTKSKAEMEGAGAENTLTIP